MNEPELVTRAELARQLKCAKSRITQLIRDGMPTRVVDDKLDRQVVLKWIVAFTSGSAGGWLGNMRGKPGLRERAASLLETGEDATSEEAVATVQITPLEAHTRLRAALTHIPAILASIEPPLAPWSILASVRAADLILGILCLDFVDAELIQEDEALPEEFEPNFKAVFRSAGQLLTRDAYEAAQKQCDDFLERLDIAVSAFQEHNDKCGISQNPPNKRRKA